MNEQRCGRVGRDAVSAIADTAAEKIAGRRGAWSVCVAPDGIVTVEHPDHTVPEDVIGTWNQAPGRLGLWREIEDELRHAITARGIKGEVTYRKRTRAGNRRAA